MMVGCLSRKLILAAFAALAVNLPAQPQLTPKHDDIAIVPLLSQRVSRWTYAKLVGCDVCRGGGDPVLSSTDRSGNRELVRLSVPAADFTAVHDVAAGPDGSLAAVGMAMSGDSRMGTFVAWISPDRSRQVITRVWPLDPRVVAIAPDGSIWVVGAVMNENYRIVYPNELRHYSESGQLLAATVVSKNRKSKGGDYNVEDTSVLMASSDRIGWMTSACQYMEFSFDAVELGRYDCPNGVLDINELGGVALSPASDLLVSPKNATTPLRPLILNRGMNSWGVVSVIEDSGNTSRILGFDGISLVTQNGGTLRRYSFSGGQ